MSWWEWFLGVAKYAGMILAAFSSYLGIAYDRTATDSQGRKRLTLAGYAAISAVFLGLAISVCAELARSEISNRKAMQEIAAARLAALRLAASAQPLQNLNLEWTFQGISNQDRAQFAKRLEEIDETPENDDVHKYLSDQDFGDWVEGPQCARVGFPWWSSLATGNWEEQEVLIRVSLTPSNALVLPLGILASSSDRARVGAEDAALEDADYDPADGTPSSELRNRRPGAQVNLHIDGDELRFSVQLPAGVLSEAVDTATTTSVTIAARYEYDAYGVNLLDAANLAQSGPYAAKNPFRFSTKWFDDETTLGYWGYRYYLPSIGRWASRDPIEERGGSNLYAASLNLPTGLVDPDGASPSPCSPVPAGTPLLPTGAMGRPIWNLKPPGDCTRKRLDKLQSLINEWCRGKGKKYSSRKPPRLCPTREYCEDMADRMVTNQNCINARRQVNNECFRGGDYRHQAEEREALEVKRDLLRDFNDWCNKDRSPKPRPRFERAPVNALNPPTDATPTLFFCPLPHPGFVVPFTIWELLFGGACGVVIAEEALA